MFTSQCHQARKLLALSAVILSLAFPYHLLWGQEKPSTKKAARDTTNPSKSAPAQPQPAPAVTPEQFDYNSPTVPDGMVFSYPPTIYYEQVVPGKDEFESTEAYKKRLANKKLSNRFAFLFEPTSSYSVYYDADQSEFSVIISLDGSIHLGYATPEYYQAIRLSLSETLSSTSTAQNAFGAEVKVIEKSYECYGIAWDIYKYPTLSIKARSLKLVFKVPNEQAKDVKPSIGVVLLCEPFNDGDAIVLTGDDVVEPTMDRPLSKHTTYRYLRLKPVALLAYNKQSGLIYQRLKIG